MEEYSVEISYAGVKTVLSGLNRLIEPSLVHNRGAKKVLAALAVVVATSAGVVSYAEPAEIPAHYVQALK